MMKHLSFLNTKSDNTLLCIKIGLIIVSFFTLGCHRAEKENLLQIAEITQKKIVFPQELVYQVGKDRIPFTPSEADYKIIVYIDSAGCTTCKMKMPVWSDIIAEYKALSDKEINFLMVLNTTETPDYIHAINQKDFRHPICFDAGNMFDKINNLPEKDLYHTFLLDASDSIIAVGNPADNPKIKKLYAEIIRGTTSSPEYHLCNNYSRAVGAVSKNRVVKEKFQLKNPTDSILTIQELVPSCDCVDVTASSDSLQPNGKLTITMLLNPEEIEAGPFLRYVDVYFNEKENPERLYLHSYVVETD